jgi:hypothetical protein
MLQSLARNTVIPTLTPPMRSALNDSAPPGENEPGRVSPEEMAAEANFANPLGAAQATMAKINAAQAKKEPEAPSPPPSAAVPAAPADVGFKAQMIIASQPEAPSNPPPASATNAARGAQFDLQA